MFCQKCRTPVRLDSSLEDLNPAAFKLLTDSSASPSQPTPGSPRSRQIRPAYSAERRKEYDRAAASGQSPVIKRTIPGGRYGSGSGGNSNLGGQNGAPKRSAADGGMSFVILNDSQLVQNKGNTLSPIADKSPAPFRSPSVTSPPDDPFAPSPSPKITVSEEIHTLSDKAETSLRLFEILSARSDIDHPICAECTDLLVEQLQRRLAGATRERDAYVEFLRQANADIPTDEEISSAAAELATAQREERAALAELERLEAEKRTLDAELAALTDESARLDAEESHFWAGRNAFAASLAEFQSRRDAAAARHEHDARALSRLQRTNVYNDTFCIGHDGYFGTINGLRLGRLSSHPVEWTEINAAWGQTLLLLATVADRLGFAFAGYRLCPLGSNSTIERFDAQPASAATVASTSAADTTHPAAPQTPDSNPATPTGGGGGGGARPAAGPRAPKPKVTVLELYCSGDLPLGLGFLHRRFDNAMVAFLECLRQLGEFVEHGAPAPPPSSSTATAATATTSTSAGGGSGGGTGGGAGGGGSGGGGLRLPYEIRKDRINDTSIRLGFNQEEAWTKACKYTLTCCKYLLAHASNVAASAAAAAGGADSGGGGA